MGTPFGVDNKHKNNIVDAIQEYYKHEVERTGENQIYFPSIVQEIMEAVQAGMFYVASSREHYIENRLEKEREEN